MQSGVGPGGVEAERLIEELDEEIAPRRSPASESGGDCGVGVEDDGRG